MKMTCRKAIQEVFAEETGALTMEEVSARIRADYSGTRWVDGTIYRHLEGLSKNRARKHHSRQTVRNAFLFREADRSYRRWDPARDDPDRRDDSPEDVAVIEEPDIAATATGAALSLEKDLEACLVGNLDQLEPGLQLYEAQGLPARQFSAGDAGRIDMLAVDPHGTYVVIEIKAGTADDSVCGQVLRYMGWVKRELADGQAVRGIVVANHFHEGAKYAIEAMPNVAFRQYQVHFTFSDVQV